jgi:hypothetical protein
MYRDLSARLTCKSTSHNRIKEVWAQNSTCDLCGNVSNGISSDTSEGEYGHVHLCFACLNKLAKEFDGAID